LRRDDLDDFISERSARNPKFPDLMAEARIRRTIGANLAELRKRKRLSQAQVAAGMATTQSIVSKLESGADVKLSTLLKYAEAVGARFVVLGVKRVAAKKATSRGSRKLRVAAKKSRSRAKAAAG
jgi:transcriptional regulator with XRE-family HTH domain